MFRPLRQAYRFASFAKIPEFLRLRDRLSNSLQYCVVMVESLIHDLILDTTTQSETERKISSMAVDPIKDQTDWQRVQVDATIRQTLNG
jgi:hypothetical protein